MPTNSAAVFGAFALVFSANVLHAQLIADYNADDQTSGAITTFTDSTGANDATGTGTVQDTNTVFNGHQYVDFAADQGFATSNLYSGDADRTVAAVYTNPDGDNGGINPIAGEAGDRNGGEWFVLQARSEYAAGDPYLAGFYDDVSSGGSPVANRLTFALATYNGTAETLYWAYGLTGSVQSASLTTTLNTNKDPFEIGEDSQEPSEGDMEIGRVQVYDTSMTAMQATADIKALQAYYATDVPEPSTYALLGLSLIGGLLFLRRRACQA